MKKILAFFVSAAFALSGFVSPASSKVISYFSDHNTQIEQLQNQSLVLEQHNENADNGRSDWHNSHGSHFSHTSHSSHSSHSSHYSARW